MSESTHEPDTTELQQRAEQAREQLMESIARLDHRAKRMAHTAADATTASGLGVAALATFWVSMSLLRRPRVHTPVQLRRKPSLFARIVRATFATMGVMATGLLVYAAERRARGQDLLPALPADTTPRDANTARSTVIQSHHIS
jgi:hypothetical protein